MAIEIEAYPDSKEPPSRQRDLVKVLESHIGMNLSSRNGRGRKRRNTDKRDIEMLSEGRSTSARGQSRQRVSRAAMMLNTTTVPAGRPGARGTRTGTPRAGAAYHRSTTDLSTTPRATRIRSGTAQAKRSARRPDAAPQSPSPHRRGGGGGITTPRPYTVYQSNSTYTSGHVNSGGNAARFGRLHTHTTTTATAGAPPYIQVATPPRQDALIRSMSMPQALEVRGRIATGRSFRRSPSRKASSLRRRRGGGSTSPRSGSPGSPKDGGGGRGGGSMPPTPPPDGAATDARRTSRSHSGTLQGPGRMTITRAGHRVSQEIARIPKAAAPTVVHNSDDPWATALEGYLVLVPYDNLLDDRLLPRTLREHCVIYTEEGAVAAEAMQRATCAQGVIYNHRGWFVDVVMDDGSEAYGKRGPFCFIDRQHEFKKVLIVETALNAAKGYRDNTVMLTLPGDVDNAAVHAVDTLERMVADLVRSGDDVPSFLRTSRLFAHEPRHLLFTTPADHTPDYVKGVRSARQMFVTTLHPCTDEFNRSDSFNAAFGGSGSADVSRENSGL